MGFNYEISDALKVDAAPIAQGHIRSGLQKAPLEIVSQMIVAFAGSQWAFIEAVEVTPFTHDGIQASTHFLSNGERFRVLLSAAA